MAKKNDGQAFGVFEKDGNTVTAENVAVAVRLRFEGWREVAPAAPENTEESRVAVLADGGDPDAQVN